MFALNEGNRWHSSKFADSLHGVVYLPSGNHAERMRRSALGDFAWQLLDPQLYLAELDCEACTPTCARLATYPWFGAATVPDYDSDESSLRAWEQRIKAGIAAHWRGNAPVGPAVLSAAHAAVQFQAERGCTHIILPTPLITDREDEAERQAEWIDAGLRASSDVDVGQPIVATVAVSEGVLNDGAFEPGGFLDTVVDQVSSRDGVDGAYIVVAQVESAHPLHSPLAVTRAYAHLTKAFVQAGYEFVFVNFADAFGIACVGLGASGFATGPSQNLRRLSLSGFQQEAGGRALPRFYSHRVIGEFLPERELEVLAELQLLRRVSDPSDYSRDLFQALNRDGSARNVAAWVESPNNVTAAKMHFLTRMIAEGSSYAERSATQRASRAERWLEDAMVEQDFLSRRLGATPVKPVFARAGEWLGQFRDGN